MNVITVASRKGGAGKTTLCAHLAGLAHAQGRRVMASTAIRKVRLRCAIGCAATRAAVHHRRARHRPRARDRAGGGHDRVFIDTSPTMWVVVQEAIRAATLVLIPARPGFLDLDAVRETVKCARERNKPYAVVLNACPVKRDEREAPAVAMARAYLEREGSRCSPAR